MFGLKWLFTVVERRRERDNQPRRPVGLFVATGVDVLMDGLVIGIGLASSRSTGTGGVSLALLAGAIGGALVFGSASSAVVAGGLAFGAAALLYLVTEELLVEAHEGAREGPGGAAMLFLGFLLFWAIRRLTGG